MSLDARGYWNRSRPQIRAGETRRTFSESQVTFKKYISSLSCWRFFILSVVELGGDPGQSPLKVCQHELQCFGPLFLRVELGLDWVWAPAASSVLNLPLLNVHPENQQGGETHCYIAFHSLCFGVKSTETTPEALGIKTSESAYQGLSTSSL